MISKVVALSDVCTAESSNIAQKDLADNSGKYSIYGASGFIKKVDFYKQEKPYIAVVKDGAGVGRVSLLPEYSSVIGTMQYILPNECVDINFLHYLLVKMNLARYHSGATIPHIYFKDYKKERFLLPTLDVQHKIAAVLDKASEIIADRKRQLEQLDLLVKSRFVEMFGDPVTNEKGWAQVTLREVSLRVSDGPFGSNLKSAHYSESGVRIIRLQNIGVSEFLDTDKAFVPLEHYETLKKHTCKPGDVIIGTLGEPNLRACILPEYVEMAINKADCVHFVSDDGKVHPRFVCEYINQPATLALAGGSIHGQTRARISMSQVAALPIYVPPLALQNRFAAFAEAADKSKFEIQQGLKKLELQYNALMQRYFG